MLDYLLVLLLLLLVSLIIFSSTDVWNVPMVKNFLCGEDVYVFVYDNNNNNAHTFSALGD